jgi:hypothetical protein
MANQDKVTKLLKRNKYYIKAKNKVCAYCNDRFGCCKGCTISFEDTDFDFDFKEENKVRALLNTNIFWVVISLDAYSSYIRIYVKDRTFEKHKRVCVLWSPQGCVLRHDIRPNVCRRATCSRIGETISRNVRNADKDNSMYNRKEYSYDELVTILKVMKDLNIDSKKRTLSKSEFEHLDWKSILSIL